jgi:hypothetical protein
MIREALKQARQQVASRASARLSRNPLRYRISKIGIDDNEAE